MSAETRLGLVILGAALLLGVVADALLRETPLGLNVSLWVAAFAVTLVLVAWWRRIRLVDGRRWMLAPLVVFGALFSWRDSDFLIALDLVAIVAALGLGVLHNPGVKPALAGLSDHARGWLVATAAGCVGIIGVLADIRWFEVARGGRSRRIAAVVRGLLVTLPLLLVFGALFAAADAAFDQLVNDLVPEIESPATHVTVILLFSWMSAGLLREFLTVSTRTAPEKEATPTLLGPFRLGSIELAITLGVLNLLFLAFVVVQVRYFFGGDSRVQVTPGLTYADYARQGFFELVTVAALVLPVLLLIDWLRRRQDRAEQRIFQAFSGTLIALLFVVMVSALQRMRLYQREYGLTELRVYTTAFMLFLAVVFIWFIATVLRGRRERFALGMMIVGFAAIFVLHAVNPDALIARTNIERAREGKPFDLVYLQRLSADATPTLVRELPTLVREVDDQSYPRRYVVGYLLEEADADQDWRSWSWSRSRARAAVDDHRAELERLARPGRD